MTVCAYFLMSRPVTHPFKNVEVWYSQQADEGNAPGYPMGFGRYRGIELVRVMGDKEEE